MTITTWILIILMNGSGKSSLAVEFHNKENCETAKKEIKNESGFGTPILVCVKK